MKSNLGIKVWLSQMSERKGVCKTQSMMILRLLSIIEKVFICRKSWLFYGMVFHKSVLFVSEQQKLAGCLTQKTDPIRAKIRSYLNSTQCCAMS